MKLYKDVKGIEKASEHSGWDSDRGLHECRRCRDGHICKYSIERQIFLSQDSCHQIIAFNSKRLKFSVYCSSLAKT